MIKNSIQSPHILIVDDDPDQLRLLVAALRNTPYRVSVELDGGQGYARAAALAPDLILLDVSMPGQNGLTVARLLKSNSATRAIPIIFLSARADDQERLTGLKTGAVDYIRKPFYVDEILERIRIHLMLAQGKPPTAQETDETQPLPDADAALRKVCTNLQISCYARCSVFGTIERHEASRPWPEPECQAHAQAALSR